MQRLAAVTGISFEFARTGSKLIWWPVFVLDTLDVMQNELNSTSKCVARILSSLFATSAFLIAVISTGWCQTKVAVELVLAVDASSSVDDREYALQVEGYVRAFRDPSVIAAITGLGGTGIAVTYVEWSSRFRQVQSVQWMHVHDEASSRGFAQAIERQAKQLQASGTALGEAVLYSIELFDDNGFEGNRQIVDVSADDRYNAGSSPSYAQTRARQRNVIVNGLAVDPTGKLTQYFKDNVIAGPASFVVTANSYDAFATAIKSKLLRELRQVPLAALPVPG